MDNCGLLQLFWKVSTHLGGPSPHLAVLRVTQKQSTLIKRVYCFCLSEASVVFLSQGSTLLCMLSAQLKPILKSFFYLFLIMKVTHTSHTKANKHLKSIPSSPSCPPHLKKSHHLRVNNQLHVCLDVLIFKAILEGPHFVYLPPMINDSKWYKKGNRKQESFSVSLFCA